MPATLKIDDYWIINNEYAGIVSLESVLCENCSKIIFDKMQIDEIHAFMSTCLRECDIQKWPHYTGFCIVCSPVVRMRYSALHFCLDYYGQISTAFISNYTLNYNALQLLYAAGTFQ